MSFAQKIAVMYWVGALLIGVSRVMAGVHWSADIIVGYILGGVVAVVFYRVYVYLEICQPTRQPATLTSTSVPLKNPKNRKIP